MVYFALLYTDEYSAKWFAPAKSSSGIGIVRAASAQWFIMATNTTRVINRTIPLLQLIFKIMKTKTEENKNAFFFFKVSFFLRFKETLEYCVWIEWLDRRGIPGIYRKIGILFVSVCTKWIKPLKNLS